MNGNSFTSKADFKLGKNIIKNWFNNENSVLLSAYSRHGNKLVFSYLNFIFFFFPQPNSEVETRKNMKTCGISSRSRCLPIDGRSSIQFTDQLKLARYQSIVRTQLATSKEQIDGNWKMKSWNYIWKLSVTMFITSYVFVILARTFYTI